MAAIPEHKCPTLQAVDIAMEAAQDRKPRLYLGMSSIGKSCLRALWYDFRWCTPINFKAGTLYNFDDGHRSEDIMAARLRMVNGIELHTADPATGQQFGFSDFGGHFSGHMDGAIIGIIQAPKTWHVWEHKATNEKKQAELGKLKQQHGEKEALCNWDRVYYAQAQCYMHYTQMDRHFLTCSTAGSRATLSCRTNYVKEDAIFFIERAGQVIQAKEPLERVSEKPDWYECKWCNHFSICKGGRVPQVNCRTCAHSSPMPDGTWKCEAHGFELNRQHQEGGCPDHLFIPALIHYGQMINADNDNNPPQWVMYRHENGKAFCNTTDHAKQRPALHEPMFTSRELYKAITEIVTDDGIEVIKSTFTGSYLTHSKPLLKAASGEDFNDSLDGI